MSDSNDDKPAKSAYGYAAASFNESTVYWLGLTMEERQRIVKAGGSAPSYISGDDYYVAAQRAAQKNTVTHKL